MTKKRDYVLLYINGERHEIRGSESFMKVADFLRYKRGLTGTKIVCAEGDCGACSVLKATPGQPNTRVKGFVAIDSCISMVAQLDGSSIVTVEGLHEDGQLSAVQNCLLQAHGTQCGYCTPGFVIAMTAMMEQQPATIDEQRVKNYLTGNLCRCTGYQQIIRAGLNCRSIAYEPLKARYFGPKIRQQLKAARDHPVAIDLGPQQWWAPTTVRGANQILKDHPDTRIIAAGSDLGVAINKGKEAPQKLLSLHLIDELYQIGQRSGRLVVGAQASLADLRRYCNKKVPELANLLDIFAAPQIKNVATLIGNIATGSPIGDNLPFLLISDTKISTSGGGRARRIALEDFYTGYRRNLLKPGQWIRSIDFEIPQKKHFVRLRKHSQRQDLDIATVSSAVQFIPHANRGTGARHIKEARIAFGGVGPVAQRLPAAETFLTAEPLTEQRIDQAIELIQSACKPISDVRGSAAYRRVLMTNLFRKSCLEFLQSKGSVQHA